MKSEYTQRLVLQKRSKGVATGVADQSQGGCYTPPTPFKGGGVAPQVCGTCGGVVNIEAFDYLIPEPDYQPKMLPTISAAELAGLPVPAARASGARATRGLPLLLLRCSCGVKHPAGRVNR